MPESLKSRIFFIFLFFKIHIIIPKHIQHCSLNTLTTIPFFDEITNEEHTRVSSKESSKIPEKKHL